MEAGGGSALRQGGGGGEENEQHTTTIRWKPNEQCLEMLLAMGIDRNAAIKGLYYTGNHSAEFAASYVFDNPDMDEELDSCMRIESEGQRQEVTRGSHVHDSDDDTGEIPHYKMVFVVNTSLGMDIGKTAAQVGHASVGLFRRLIGDEKNFGNQLIMWEEEGEKKVVLRGEDLSHLKQLEKQAISLDLPTCIIQDAGRTEVPAGSVTVLAIFGREEIVRRTYRTGMMKGDALHWDLDVMNLCLGRTDNLVRNSVSIEPHLIFIEVDER